MRKLLTIIATVTLAGCGVGVIERDADAPTEDRVTDALRMIPQYPHKRVCNAAVGAKTCFAHVRITADGQMATSSTPSGLGAADLVSAYKLDTSVDPGATIAIIDAYGYTNAESDLATYRSQYGLPACTKASGCLKIVNQSGATSPLPSNPPSNDDWTVETALDLQMASAACPKCKLLLVQADDDSGDGLYIANNTAATLGATVVSNSWGSPESGSMTSYETYFNHPGIGYFVAAGDDGYNDGGQGPDYPSTSAYVVAVGGTTLTQSSATSRGWVEGAWGTSSGEGAGGSSCSTSIAKPSWQKQTVCKYRATSDVAAVGDPNTGLAVYNKSSGGWQVIGGTSAASPFVAGVFALTGHAKDGGAFIYGNAGAWFDVTTGSNGSCGNVLCNAGAGWDGPTGMGTPNGAVLKTGSTTCTPACSGKSCGPDGCGGTCGTCATGSTCNAAGACIASCTPACSGKTCGSDGCGGTCGTCASGKTCSSTGTCVAGTCTPACSGKTCGADGCGGTCGTCASGSTCSATGTCVAACTPNCSGKSCGSDGCGGTCGTCSGGATCSSAGACTGGGTCSHAICSTGTKLTSSCDPCATKICAQDSYCCNTSWDSTCVGEVASICGESCGSGGTSGGGTSTCTHAICGTGAKLKTGCDPCATKICAQDSYCCKTTWDSTCVSEVASICGESC